MIALPCYMLPACFHYVGNATHPTTLLRLLIELCVGFESGEPSRNCACVHWVLWTTSIQIIPWPFSLLCGSDQVKWPQSNFMVADSICSLGRREVLSDNWSEIKREKKVPRPIPWEVKSNMHYSAADQDESAIKILYLISKSTQLLSQIAFFLGGDDISVFISLDFG